MSNCYATLAFQSLYYSIILTLFTENAGSESWSSSRSGGDYGKKAKPTR
jgi:hypothetical protein